MLSCYYKKPEVTAFLLKYVDEINLFEAAAAGKFDVVAHLVYTYPEAVNYYAEDGFTPLGLACYFGQYEIARYLVLKGADVNLPSNNGFNVYPIHSAAAGNYTGMVAGSSGMYRENIKTIARWHINIGILYHQMPCNFILPKITGQSQRRKTILGIIIYSLGIFTTNLETTSNLPAATASNKFISSTYFSRNSVTSGFLK